MTKRYADVIVDISHEKLDRPFQYKIPDKYLDILEVGACVTVPFGKGNRLIKGYCVNITDKCQFAPERTKEIYQITPKGVEATDSLIELAAWIRKNYGSTMIQALKVVLPAKQAVKKLEARVVSAKVDREELIALLGECERKKQTAKARLLRALLDQDGIPYQWITGKLSVSASAINSLEKSGVIQITATESYRNPVKLQADKDEKRQLSPAQQEIVDTVLSEYDREIRKTYLIHGITGSGKTEVYMQLIEGVVQRGKQAIVLIPEIALTYQTLLRFYKRFGDRVSVMNSTLSPGEKYDQCERAKKGEIDVIIGPRSALFTPFSNIGLIVIDEEHEGSYKSESSPKYHARETAEQVAQIHHASVVLGSATPSLESYYRAKMGEYRLFTLKERLTGGQLPKVYIEDLREELAGGNRSIFSRRLQQLMEDRFKKKEQVILFLNRRGYAGFISCRSCGHVMKCPHCDVSLSEHRDGRLWCHYCGYSEPKVPVCPKCGSKYIMGFKAGTQQIEEKLKEMFPNVRTLRMDGDTTKTKESYEQILNGFANEEADVLIGTQMIVKGHDFPKVTLVGVLAADLSLSANDYRAGERTFQLLTQAVGRAGRGNLPGEAVIQTYQPEHYAVVLSAKQDYEAFYEEEILYRELPGYPPTAHMLAVLVQGRDQMACECLAQQLANVVKSMEWADRERPALLGPTPCTIGKINDIYRYVFYLKQQKYENLVRVKDCLEEHLNERQPADCRPANCRPAICSVQFDFDPMNTM